MILPGNFENQFLQNPLFLQSEQSNLNFITKIWSLLLQFSNKMFAKSVVFNALHLETYYCHCTMWLKLKDGEIPSSGKVPLKFI